MFRMIKGELHKLLTRRIVLLLVGLLIVNAVMSVLYYKEQSRLYDILNDKNRTASHTYP